MKEEFIYNPDVNRVHIKTPRGSNQRFLYLGLKKETADCSLLPLNNKVTTVLVKPSTKDIVNTIPAWSLHRLWELYWSNKVGTDCLFGCGKYVSPYAKMIAMIEYDIEDGTFNKEYLD